jgi:hypothetical protein
MPMSLPVLAYISDLSDKNFSKAPQLSDEPIETYETRIFRLSSDLPNDSYLDPHGQTTLAVIDSVAQPYAKKLVSVRYFNKGDSLREYKVKFHIAFTSPAILNLPAGSVVGMNMSSSFVINNARCTISPALFDEVVNGISSILRQRGITTVLSVGNGNPGIVSVPGVLSTDAIVIGAVKDSSGTRVFDSNYGTAVTCYAETPAKINGQSVLHKGKPFGESSAAMAIITGLVLKIQHHRLSQNKRYLLPHEIKRILSEANKVTVYLPDGSATQVPLPTWEGILPRVNAIPSGPPIS